MIGYVVFWSVSKTKVPFSDIPDVFQMAPPAPANAWKRATSDAEKVFRKQPSGEFLISMRIVSEEMPLKRQFLGEAIRNVPDKEKRVVTWPLIAAEFDGQDATYDILARSDAERILCEQIVAEIESLYAEHLAYADGRDFRKQIRELLLDALYGTPVREAGGVYFVPVSDRASEIVTRLRKGVEEVNTKGANIEFYHLRLLDEDEAAVAGTMKTVVEALEKDALNILGEINRLKDLKGKNKMEAGYRVLRLLSSLEQKASANESAFNEAFQKVRDLIDVSRERLLDQIAVNVELPL